MTKLTLILPAYNEATILPWSVRTVMGYASAALQAFDWSLVVVDNASTDNTSAVVVALQQELPGLQYLRIPQKGRGIALRTAWNTMDFDISLYMDVDLAVALDAVAPLVDMIASGAADIAVGSRYATGAKIQRSFMRSVTSVGYNFLTRLCIQLKTRDAQCGFKAIRKAVAVQLLPSVRDDGWFFDTELLLQAERRGFRVRALPVSWVETRPALRKSKVHVLRTITHYLIQLFRLRVAMLRGRL
ncbi:MAG: glycosyltransferase [Patescibacteria group bacterium]